MNNLFEFSLCYQAGSNGSVQDFNEQKRNEQQKLEEIKVHIQHLKFIPTCVYELSQENVCHHSLTSCLSHNFIHIVN